MCCGFQCIALWQNTPLKLTKIRKLLKNEGILSFYAFLLTYFYRLARRYVKSVLLKFYDLRSGGAMRASVRFLSVTTNPALCVVCQPVETDARAEAVENVFRQALFQGAKRSLLSAYKCCSGV